ncbi:MAG: helix-turn-helix domain-containing protein [Acidobacteria bacterium]|nr:helix-turn-helix domain-containing protein [Acidobacteriota bacterium]
MREWRKEIKVHPAAELYPDLSADERVELANDIKENGLRVPIVLYVDESSTSWLLDGRHRLDALAACGGDVEAALTNAETYHAPDHKPYELARSLNAHRRHLTMEQKHRLVGGLLKDHPELSNSEIARRAGIDRNTAAADRAKAEAEGTIPKMARTVGRDGRARTATPAKRNSTPPVKPKPSTPPARARDNAVIAVNAMLARDVGVGLGDLIRLLNEHTGRLEHLDRWRREEFVDRFTVALGLTVPSKAAPPPAQDSAPSAELEEAHRQVRELNETIEAQARRIEELRTRNAELEKQIGDMAKPARTRRRTRDESAEQTDAEFGARVKAAREAIKPKLSQAVLAGQLGLDQVTISRIELGKIPLTPELRAKLEERLGLTSEPAAEPAIAELEDLGSPVDVGLPA